MFSIRGGKNRLFREEKAHVANPALLQGRLSVTHRVSRLSEGNTAKGPALSFFILVRDSLALTETVTHEDVV